jgi:signal transduction histidine kinase
MSNLRSSLPVTYQDVLRDYLARPDEENLQQAYELGRAAMNAGLGVFDVIRLHHEALTDGIVPGGASGTASRFAPALETFLLEVLSPFEATHRGFRTAMQRLEQLNSALAERNDALAASNSHLEEEIGVRRRAEEALRELSARVLTAQEEERKRISRELHDEIGQALTAVNVTVSMLKKQAGTNEEFQKKVAEAEQLIAQSMETVHAFARELRPAALDHLGVLAAVRAHLTSFSRRTGIRTELAAHSDLARLSPQCSEVIFRIVQEAMSNVYKHAEATRVKVEFGSSGGELTMEIADNGRAFDVGEKMGAKRTGRLGLIGMRERVRLVGGTFDVDSAAGKGTRVLVRIPLEAGNVEPISIQSTHEEDIRAVS